MRDRTFLTLLAAMAAAALWVAAPLALADNTFEANIDSDWNKAGNWDNGVLPGADGENVNIYDDFTVDLSTPGATTGTAHLRVGNNELGKTATLNIYAGATLDVDTVNNSNDIILGREDLAQSGSKGFINQMGGTVTAGDYIKMSGDKEYAAGSLYRISGGSLYILDQLQFGRDDSHSTMMKFEVVGSGPSVIEINDVKVEQNLDAQATMSFVIDAGGVTPITVLDEMQIGNGETVGPGVGDMLLELSLSDVPPAGDITLIQAGRITQDQQFLGLPGGSDVSAAFGSNLYTWTIDYPDDTDVVLSNLRVSAIVPEPASLVLCVLGLLGIAAIRRRG